MRARAAPGARGGHGHAVTRVCSARRAPMRLRTALCTSMRVRMPCGGVRTLECCGCPSAMWAPPPRGCADVPPIRRHGGRAAPGAGQGVWVPAGHGARGVPVPRAHDATRGSFAHTCVAVRHLPSRGGAEGGGSSRGEPECGGPSREGAQGDGPSRGGIEGGGPSRGGAQGCGPSRGGAEGGGQASRAVPYRWSGPACRAAPCGRTPGRRGRTTCPGAAAYSAGRVSGAAAYSAGHAPGKAAYSAGQRPPGGRMFPRDRAPGGIALRGTGPRNGRALRGDPPRKPGPPGRLRWPEEARCLFRRGCRILEVWSSSRTSRSSGRGGRRV